MAKAKAARASVAVDRAAAAAVVGVDSGRGACEAMVPAGASEGPSATPTPACLVADLADLALPVAAALVVAVVVVARRRNERLAVALGLDVAASARASLRGRPSPCS